ncbi:MAG: hypothetical protein CUR32_09770 [Flavobacterium sp.]|nr:MAG: hypothetical protein CUR32_09770 [Flavobacterium sp.] [Flavobacterium sp. FEMGT703F]
MKKVFTILFFVLSFSAFAQKVKLKKDKVIIDDVEVYNYERQGDTYTFSTLSAVEFVTVLSTEYQVRNDAYYRTPNPSKYGMSPLKKEFVFTVRFLKSGQEIFIDMDHKDVIKAIYKSKLVDENGNIDEEKLTIFINKYNNENLKLKIN